MNNFVEKDSFEEVHSYALELLQENPNQLNLSLQVTFPIDIVKKPALPDVLPDAEDFQKVEKPAHLHINHGMFIKENGIQNLINELKNKKNSNRAIISLIHQDDIVGKGDNPIPSFMIIQAAIENNTLFLTTYFRALEVSTFLRINLEEIRMILNQIHSNFDEIESVNLHIFAFRAYIQKDINPLKRARIELLKETEILKTLESPIKKDLISLLQEKIRTKTTVVDDHSFHLILEILQNANVNDAIPELLKETYTTKIVQEIIYTSNEIKKVRSVNSHSTKIDELYATYSIQIQKLIDEIAKIS
jgi:hypothetical protein